jgi:hypothetical protein
MVLIGVLSLLITLARGGAAPEDNVASIKRSARPTLTITSMHPLEVVGRGFNASERVVVSTGTKRKSVTANSLGRFEVRFVGLKCAAATIRAVGPRAGPRRDCQGCSASSRSRGKAAFRRPYCLCGLAIAR